MLRSCFAVIQFSSQFSSVELVRLISVAFIWLFFSLERNCSFVRSFFVSYRIHHYACCTFKVNKTKIVYAYDEISHVQSKTSLIFLFCSFDMEREREKKEHTLPIQAENLSEQMLFIEWKAPLMPRFNFEWWEKQRGREAEQRKEKASEGKCLRLCEFVSKIHCWF